MPYNTSLLKYQSITCFDPTVGKINILPVKVIKQRIHAPKFIPHAFRKSVWDKLGGMDPLFNPFYWEDIDLSYRGVKAGYRLVFEKRSVVRHYHQEGKIMRKYSTWYIRAVASRNQFQFIWKNIDDPGIMISHMVWTPIVVLRAMLTLDSAFICGYFIAVFRLPHIIGYRLSSH